MPVNCNGLENIFQKIPLDLSDEVFQTLVSADGVHIERIISRGHHSSESGWYDQEKNEWVILLKGEALLEFVDGKSVQLKPGDYVNIPAHQKHKVAWTDPRMETIWLAVHY